MVGGDHDAILTTENGRRSASRNALVKFWLLSMRNYMHSFANRSAV